MYKFIHPPAEVEPASVKKIEQSLSANISLYIPAALAVAPAASPQPAAAAEESGAALAILNTDEVLTHQGPYATVRKQAALAFLAVASMSLQYLLCRLAPSQLMSSAGYPCLDALTDNIWFSIVSLLHQIST